MAISKITEAEKNSVRIYGLADRPGFTKEAMQQRFDGLGILAIDKINEVIDYIGTVEGKIERLEIITESLQSEMAQMKLDIISIKEYLNKFIQSVDEIPETEEDGIIYFVKGEVTVE